MFDKFFDGFTTSDSTPPPPARFKRRLRKVDGFTELMSVAGGWTFGKGLYRLHSVGSGTIGQQALDSAFPEFAGRVSVFAFDWLGRQFAIDFARELNGQPLLMMFEPGTSEALEIPLPFSEFHNEELTAFHDEVLASGFFESWAIANAGSTPLGFSDCVGLTIPLQLGGSDTEENLEVVDFEVYWDLLAQIRASTHNSPVGASIRAVSIEE